MTGAFLATGLVFGTPMSAKADNNIAVIDRLEETLGASQIDDISPTGDCCAYFFTDSGELFVTGIGHYSMSKDFDKSLIKSIVFAEGITQLEPSVFSGCTNLKSVSFPKSLTTIGDYAFYNCPLLKTISLPWTVKKIGTKAFGYTKSGANTGLKMNVDTGSAAESYAKKNGITYQSTLGEPKIYGIHYKEVDSTGYTITGDMEDLYGVSKVEIQTYINGDSENYKVGTATISGNGHVFSYKINPKDFGNYQGEYVNRVIVTNKNGQQTISARRFNLKKALADNDKPQITVLRVVEQKDYCLINFTVSDSSEIIDISFPSASVYNGWQDDIDPVWPRTYYDNSFRDCYTISVSRSDHNNETGKYSTWIYAYDAAGKVSSKEVNYEIGHSIPIHYLNDYYRDEYMDFDISTYPWHDNSLTKAVTLQIWSDKNGKDDIKTYTATRKDVQGADLQNYFGLKVPYSNHNYETGKYHVSVVITAADGSKSTPWEHIIEVPARVLFSAEGAQQIPESLSGEVGGTFCIPLSVPIKENYAFKNWNTKADGTGTTYEVGDRFEAKDIITLYAQWERITPYTIIYCDTSATKQEKEPGKTVVLAPPTVEKRGYDFKGWNEKEDGSGKYYAGGSKYSEERDLYLYAIWEPREYNIIYDMQGGTGGPKNTTRKYDEIYVVSDVVPKKSGYVFKGWRLEGFGHYNSSLYHGGERLGSADNDLKFIAQWVTYEIRYESKGGIPSYYVRSSTEMETPIIMDKVPTKEGYTFAGWNTQEDGTGTTYKAGDTYKGELITTLYAQWKIATYAVNYNVNGGSNAPAAQTKTYGKELTLSNTKPTRTGYNFAGWNTKADGSGTAYAVGTVYTGNADLTLYAQWKALTYGVTYNGNGGSNVPASQTKTYGKDLTLSSTKPTRTGYSFTGWNTKADGNGTVYAPGAVYKANAKVTLYAQWKVITYTITYNANGGTGAPSKQTKTYGKDLTLSSTKPTKSGYAFTGWNTKADGSGTAYAAGTVYKSNAALTLYAQWSVNESGNPFADIRKDVWQYEPAKYVYDKKIMVGTGTNSLGKVIFKPNNTLTRAEFATVLYNMEGRPAVSYKNVFSDVPSGQWYTSPILWANNTKVAAGYGKTFGVNNAITREQMAQMLYSYAKLKGYNAKFNANALDTFKDKNKISAWATDAMKWAVTNGIMKGKGSGILDPVATATRAECAAMIKNFNDAFKK